MSQSEDEFLDSMKDLVESLRGVEELGVSHFHNTTDFLAQLKATGQPLVLTINGKAELVVQDAKSYQRLLEIAERLETIEAVKEGLASMERSEGRSADAAFADLEKELHGPAER